MEQHLPFSHSVLTKNTLYYRTKSTTPIHTGGGTIESHFWIELPLKLDNQTIQIKVLVCDSEYPYDILIGRTSLTHISAWQDYANNKLYVTSVAFESKDDPTQMTKIVIYNYILYYIQKTIHSKLICTDVHS